MERLLDVAEQVRRVVAGLPKEPASCAKRTRVVQRSSWLTPGAADRLVDETDQLIAIFVASARTKKCGL